MSKSIRINYLVDAIAFLGCCLAMLSGIFGLFLPSSDSLDELHAHGSSLMILASAVHLVLHWQWVKAMTRRTVSALLSRGSSPSKEDKLKVVINALLTVSCLVTAVSGVSLHEISAPSDDFRGGPFGRFLTGQPSAGEASPPFGESTSTLIHTCAAVVTIGLVAIHLWMHRRWVTNVTGRFFSSLWQRPDSSKAPPVQECFASG